jgi:hypothetical protein
VVQVVQVVPRGGAMVRGVTRWYRIPFPGALLKGTPPRRTPVHLVTLSVTPDRRRLLVVPPVPPVPPEKTRGLSLTQRMPVARLRASGG